MLHGRASMVILASIRTTADIGKETGRETRQRVLSSYGTTIFEVMSRLAAEHGAVNLGQGFPEGLEAAGADRCRRRAL